MSIVAPRAATSPRKEVGVILQRHLLSSLLIWLSFVTGLLASLPANAAWFATQDVMVPFAQKGQAIAGPRM